MIWPMLVTAQIICLLMGILLGGVGTKMGGAFLLFSFFFIGAQIAYVIRERIGGGL